MSPYENAMMKASIQTSIYKLMLMELGIQTGQTAVFYVENSMGNYSVEELAHMDRLRYKPKNITKGVNRCFSRTLAAFIAQGRTPAITMDTSASQDIKQFMFQASGGKTLMKLKLRKYMKELCKAGYKVKTLRMLFNV
jgi:hypothetical protein